VLLCAIIISDSDGLICSSARTDLGAHGPARVERLLEAPEDGAHLSREFAHTGRGSAGGRARERYRRALTGARLPGRGRQQRPVPRVVSALGGVTCSVA